MRLNKFIALHTSYSRRMADDLIASGQVKINGEVPQAGYNVQPDDKVFIDDKLINTTQRPVTQTIILHKPVSYVCSRNGQGSPTIYELLPQHLHILNPVGRLDKNSSGLLLLTNDGELANQLTHPRYAKRKVYSVTVDKPLAPLHQQMISDHGIQLEDGASKFQITRQSAQQLTVTMQEGRNRQIRRTFAALGYTVTQLHRTDFGNYQLGDLASGNYRAVT